MEFLQVSPGPCTQQETFASQYLSLLLEQRVLHWHSLTAKGCNGDLPSGGMASHSSANPFRCLCLHGLTIDMPLVSVVQSIERVAPRDGLFPWLVRQSNN